MVRYFPSLIFVGYPSISDNKIEFVFCKNISR